MARLSSLTAARLSRAALLAMTAATVAALLTAGGAARDVPAGSGIPVPRVHQARATEGPGPAGLVSAPGPLRGVAAYLRSRAGVAQVALYNRITGRTYLLTEGSALQYTASIVKVDIMAMWLRRYQSAPGIIPASIPYSIRYLLTNMITVSDNSAATGLFYFGGGCGALTQFNRLIPTRDTSVGCETPTYYGWGNTTTSAADQAAIVRTLAYPGPVLQTQARRYGLSLMESVTQAQRWGVSCGPWGPVCDPPDYATPVPGVRVALKNGWKFVPTCPAQDDTCPWQVNSIGWVRGQGRDYVLAVLTTDDPAGPGSYGLDYGITTIQGVSRLVWDNLGAVSARSDTTRG